MKTGNQSRNVLPWMHGQISDVWTYIWNFLLIVTGINCAGVVLEIYLNHKFEWSQEGLNCEYLAYKVVTNPLGHLRSFRLGGFGAPQFATLPTGLDDLCWDTSTSSQVSNCDGVVLEIYLDHKFQWPQEGLNCEFLAYEVVT